MAEQQGESATGIMEWVAAVCHRGTLEKGHYVALCWNEGTRQWIKADDSITSVVSADQAWDEAATSGYLFLYRPHRPKTMFTMRGLRSWQGSQVVAEALARYRNAEKLTFADIPGKPTLRITERAGLIEVALASLTQGSLVAADPIDILLRILASDLGATTGYRIRGQVPNLSNMHILPTAWLWTGDHHDTLGELRDNGYSEAHLITNTKKDGKHWVYVKCELERNQVLVYDSLGSRTPPGLVRSRVVEEMSKKGRSPPKVAMLSGPRQTTGLDCT
jgi:hypothetical protein